MLARVRVPPKAAREVNAALPTYVERILLKLLEPDRDLRYANVDEVLEDLERERVDSSVMLRLRKHVRRYRLAVAGIALAGAAALGLAWTSRLSPPAVVAEGPVTTIGVLPFENLTGSDELGWMERGVPYLLVTDLSQIPGLRPVLSGRMERALADLGRDGETRFDEETIHAASEILGADFMLSGSLVETTDGVRIGLELRESICSSGLLPP